MRVRKAYLDDSEEMSGLITKVFNEFVAPDFTNEGILKFMEVVTPEAIFERIRAGAPVFIMEHWDSDDIIGMIELIPPDHIRLFFVRADCQRHGLGRILLDFLVAYIKKYHPETAEISVNSAPCSVEAYRKLGFEPTAEEQAKDGFRFRPMKKKIRSA